MSILLRLPKDLGEGLLCASAVQKLKNYASEQGQGFLVEGSKMMHAWVENLADLSAEEIWQSVEAVQKFAPKERDTGIER